jgi:hypothetical protein
MTEKQRSDFWNLVDEVLEGRTAYDTIHILKGQGKSDDEIKSELQKRHGLNALQCSQALREYVEEQRKEVKDV